MVLLQLAYELADAFGLIAHSPDMDGKASTPRGVV